MPGSPRADAGAAARPRRGGRPRRWALRLAGAALGLLLLLAAGAGAALLRVARDLPDYQALAVYEPPTVTRVHAGDGRLLAEYARERRVFVPVGSIPEDVKEAFIAAEDERFYAHPGVDPVGILRTLASNIDKLEDGRRPGGASTITQQVAKNFLLTNELSLSRKVKEAILALRIERAYTKDKILELYLNEIYLGNRSYGVAAAALNYFDKSLDELTLAEAAFLAGLPQAPSRYDPTKSADAALARRAYVLGQMVEDGYVTAAAAAAAGAEPLALRRRGGDADAARADFFVEEVRRQLVASFGEAGFYESGLSVQTTVDTDLQRLADRTLRDGLARVDRREGTWRGPLGRLDAAVPRAGGGWAAALSAFDPGFELGDWRLALVLATDGRGARIGLADGREALLPFAGMRWARSARANGRPGPAPRSATDVAAPGDVVAVQREGGDGEAGAWSLRQRPAVEGALVALDPHTGRVLAMSGGFSYRQSAFNRATQARRQPGSAFKPFVYLAGLEAGKTPASVVVDGPVEYSQGPGLPPWRPENYSQRYYGPSTLRLGLEKSRNLMTVRLADEVGMDRVLDVARRFGIDGGLTGNLAESLGAGEVTPLALATAYAMLVNGGRKVDPYLVERIQDRHGRTVMRRDGRPCPGCAGVRYAGQGPPAVPDARPPVTDPRLAYQMVAMLQGVVDRGSAAAARELQRPLAGKTGTTNDVKDAWFAGFAPDLAVAVYVGHDQPRSLGDRETGGSLAVPIWVDFMRGALDGVPRQPFRTPPGLQLVLVDAATGRLAAPGAKNGIVEAFLPGTEPKGGGGGGGVRPASGGPGAAGGGGAPPPSLGGLY